MTLNHFRKTIHVTTLHISQVISSTFNRVIFIQSGNRLEKEPVLTGNRWLFYRVIMEIYKRPLFDTYKPVILTLQ